MQDICSRNGAGFESIKRACLAQGWIWNKLILWICVLGALTAPRLMAIVDAHSPANTNAPPDGAPWDHVGTVNGASGIYVGNGWVVGAGHVGWNNFLLNGTLYDFDGNALRLTNSDGSTTDMVMFHLAPPPNLPSLALASNTPAAYSQVDMIGYGRIAGSAETTIGAYRGFYWSASGYKSWGNNRVNNTGGAFVINAGAGNITVFQTDFSSPGTPAPGSQTTDEAQAAVGDSGGAVFHQTGSGWELAGMVDAVGAYGDQLANTSVYADETYFGDIATYRAQIAAWRASTAPVLTISRVGTTIQICWPDTGIAYDLEAANSLSNPTWIVVASNPPVSNGQVCVTLPATGLVRFFRLHLTGPPTP